MAIGFKHGSGGGLLLNFDVINFDSKEGTVQPSNPKENTIWIDNNWAQNGWTFGPELPLRKSKNKNFATYPYASSTNTSSGVTFTDNGNGTITVNGTASKDVYFRASRATAEEGMMLLPAGTYFLSGCPAGGSSGTYAVQLITMDDALNTVSTIEDYGIGKVFSLTEGTLCRVNFAVKSGAKVNGLNVYFQVERGESATAFEKGNAQGQVWIKPDQNGAVSFDALKQSGKNQIVLQPGEIKMFTEKSGWKVQSECKIYQGGAWKALKAADATWDGYYFKNGEQYASVTGGWTTDGFNNAGTATVGSTIVASASSGKTAKIGTANSVDLTNVKKLWYDSPNGANGYNSGYLCVTSDKSSTNFPALVEVKAGGGSLDVSSLSGKYYICLYASGSGGNTAYADISAIWTE